YRPNYEYNRKTGRRAHRHRTSTSSSASLRAAVSDLEAGKDTAHTATRGLYWCRRGILRTGRGGGGGIAAISGKSTDHAAADACSKPRIASRVISPLNSSTNGSSVVMLNGSCANNSRFRTKMLHWPISQIAPQSATCFCVPGGRNRRTISTAAVR